MVHFLNIPKQTILLLAGFGLLLILIIGYLLHQLTSAKKKQNLAEDNFHQLEGKINRVELENLESKLNPHLFKNIFNSIQSHAYQTYYALDKLAEVLDYILYESRNKFVTPKEEIEFAMNLIEINKIKLSPLFELKIKSKINHAEPLYEQRLFAPLISIDLIENAFKHADLQRSGAFISITFEFKNNIFSLTVANKISKQKPMKKEKAGIGTKTLEQRLKIIYGNHYKLNQYTEDDVYIAHLKIDLFGHKTKMLAAR